MEFFNNSNIRNYLKSIMTTRAWNLILKCLLWGKSSGFAALDNSAFDKKGNLWIVTYRALAHSGSKGIIFFRSTSGRNHK
ncbi:hypothetical protein C4Q31_18710 [Leptospira borgpetersenii serovar Ceylonica]|uniref:Uncharacterized protein n=1 Tax=Leptospira borgpetersenii serovar Ballum TaxID=280505 RepID=A0A0S2IXJ2_LEPBO|nr:hypothetical protein LBBP_04078 [Leptospira borgpetersenii serovar Ballum]AXX17571.1 hypothetical protein C4Q31_18710 [Leptospira borgpetersenii serovar Ceylonica]OOV42225.1 hypothetical protein B1H38_16090 [Leptospira borgpetersenii serovar Ballum]QHE41849.1 hypothetical protein GS527_17015 [Leptospira borgpetersenii]QHH51837.1 hypothetical protein GS516_17080 [Leptospira borgpetersenii]